MYEVILKKDDESEMVDSKYVIDKNGMMYFYNKEDLTDSDAPVAIYDKEIIKKIVKTKKNKD